MNCSAIRAALAATPGRHEQQQGHRVPAAQLDPCLARQWTGEDGLLHEENAAEEVVILARLGWLGVATAAITGCFYGTYKPISGMDMYNPIDYGIIHIQK